ncbi:MAG: SNF2-related protein [Candidatus Dormibacteria bacterium]
MTTELATSAKTLLTAVISPSGRRVVLTSSVRDHDYQADWFSRLPYHAWLKSKQAWLAEPTPYAAHTILAAPFAMVEADEHISALAASWVECQRRAAELLSNAPSLAQPERRKFDAWPWQVPTYHFAMAMDAALLHVTMGGGKTKVVIDLIANSETRRVLILCPTSVRSVWRGEFAKHSDLSGNVLVLDKQSVKDRTRMADAFIARGVVPAIIVINYESVWREPFAAWSLERTWDVVVLDESARVKAATSRVSLYASDLRRVSTKRLCLTGTPMPKDPLDLFGQFRFLDPAIFGSSFHRFRSEFADMHPMIPEMVKTWKNQDELARRMALLAYRVDADVLKLPAPTHTVVPVSLSPAAARVYNELERDMIADVAGGAVTAANALVRVTRLQQVTSGYTVLDPTRPGGERIEKPLSTDKADALADLLADLPVDEPVAVFCRFRWDLDRAKEVAEKLSRTYGELSGRRHDLTDDAKMPEGIGLFAVQVKSGGVGIDLTRARYGVVLSIGYLSPGDYDQMIARMVRPGQRGLVTFWHLVCEGTIDETVYEALANKRDVIEAILDRACAEALSPRL